MAPFIRCLARPYRGWLVVILIAMLVETAMGLAGPRPFKVVLDYAVGARPAPQWLALLVGPRVADNPTALAFEHVAFSYDPVLPVLQDVTFSVEPGQFVGIVGTTGSGKSTIISLIPRFYDPASGRVLVDGRDIREYALLGVRGQIAFVLQDTVLFQGTVRDNIAYGRPSATDEEIVTAARLANADEFIVRMAGGYEAPIGERGLTLSGGQRQRIGIARAIVRNAPILILDEPTAALDSESEELVMSGLERLMKGRTVLMITHRLRTIRHADVILVLRNGMIAERGTHEELLARGEHYADLYAARVPAAADEQEIAWRAN